MKAIVCRCFGGPEVLTLADHPKPAIKADEVLVRVRAAGVNFADLVVVAGKYQAKIEPPFVPGMEIAGEIAEVGSEVTGWSVGDRIVSLTDGGGYAEYAAVRASRIFRLRTEISFEDAAGTFINYATAYGALHWRAGVKNGETCLVLGGAGGVGLAAIVLASRAGARVIGAASSAERCALMAAHGASKTIDYGISSLRDRVAELTAKRGVDVIIDPVGGEQGALSLRCIAWSGRIVTLGFPAGAVPSYPANILLVKNAAALGMFFGSYLDHAPEMVRSAVADIQDGLAGGTLAKYRIEPSRLDQLPALLERIRGRQFVGKAIVIT
jgi:NADPH2:quinone reductase